MFYVKIISLLKEREVEIPVILGGIIPEEDVSELKEMGIIEVFSPGTSINEIVEKVKAIAMARKV